MAFKMGFEGDEGTELWCIRQNTKNLERIATSLEEIAQCLKNQNQ